jgi:hypothetical protein
MFTIRGDFKRIMPLQRLKQHNNRPRIQDKCRQKLIYIPRDNQIDLITQSQPDIAEFSADAFRDMNPLIMLTGSLLRTTRLP